MAFAMTIAAAGASPEARRSFVHQASLFFVWIAIASGFVVTTEPAPFDALTLGLMILLPTVGLVAIRPMLGAMFLVMMVAGAGALIGVILAKDQPPAAIHTGVSIYLYMATFLYAAFVAKRPVAHGRVMLQASLAGALLAAICGVIGYFNLIPGAAELMTRYSRATGLFKDPNVYGPFLVLGFVYAFHLVLTRPLRAALLPAGAFAFLSLGLLLSFSRGAWTNAGIALAIYGVFYVITVGSHRARLKFLGTFLFGAIALGGVLAIALQFDEISSLLNERAALTQGYDEGPEGRFGGQQKAMRLIVENPLGIGAQVFPYFYHHEEAHNVYLSMFMNAGWIGGAMFALLMFGTVVLGLRHALVPAPSQAFFIIAYGTFVGHVLEGFLIDLDHWRHVYVVMAIVWGLMAASPRADVQRSQHEA